MGTKLGAAVLSYNAAPLEAREHALAEIASLVKLALGATSDISVDDVSAAAQVAADEDTPEFVGLRISILLDVAQLMYTLGYPFFALGPAKAASALAASSGLKAERRRALTFWGVVSADTGNVAQAVEAYAEALALATELGDSAAKCALLVNLGVALLNCAQYRDALTCFERAVALASSRAELQGFKLTALSNIALCCLHLEDFSQGVKAAETAIRESAEPKTRSELLSRVLRETNYVRLLLEVKNVELAASRAAVAKQYAARSGSTRTELAAAICEGLCDVHAGRPDVGISRLMAALEKARTLKSMLRDCLAALVKSFELIGQPEQALAFLRELMAAKFKTQEENTLQHLQLHLQGQGVIALGDPIGVETSLQRREAALRGQLAERELFRSRIEMLERLAVTAELRDDSTGEHSYRVGKLSALLAAAYGCDEETCFMLELAARLHDIGKIGVPDAILLKPGRLNESERTVMKGHTTVGAELLSKSNIPHMQMAEEIARHHHEWWEGTGYPSNLAGNEIPLMARITALADVFDALTHKRPYKDAWSVELALEEIIGLKGRQFDPGLTTVFVELIHQLCRTHSDLDAYLGEAAHNSPFLQARSKIWDTLGKVNTPSELAVVATLATTEPGVGTANIDQPTQKK